VLVMDRITGKVNQEFIPTSIRVALRGLYRTGFGSKGALAWFSRENFTYAERLHCFCV